MAEVHIVTKKEQKAERKATFRIICKGLSKEEFGSLYRVFSKEFACDAALRNPFPPGFDAKAVHEIIMHVTGTAVGGYATKKVIDAAHELFVTYMKFKFITVPKNGQVREITLYGAKGELHRFKDKKQKKQR
jgi:hypothetical protein